MSASVNTPSKAYNACSPAWEEAAALLGGTATMRAAGETYLPRHHTETKKKHEARIKRSWLYGVFRSTVDAMTGKPFERPIIVDTDDEQQAAFITDVDREGTDLTAFAKSLLRAVLTNGITYILVDSPAVSTDKEISKAEEKELGVRPYWCHIHAANLIGVDSTTVNGAKVLSRIRIREVVDVQDGEFGTKEITQVRVIYPDKWEIWRKSETAGEEWSPTENGARSVGEITLVPVYARAIGFMRSDPPLKPLAEKNLEHWQSASDQANILHVARVPLLLTKCLDLPKDGEGKPTGEISTGSVLSTNEEHGDAKWVELSGDGSIVQGQKDVDRLVDEMESLGAQLMFRKAETPKTATEEQSKSKKGDSVLHGIIGNLENALNRAFAYTAMYRADGVQVPTITIYRDFSTFNPAGLTAKDLNDARKEREISHDVYIEQMKLLGLKTDKSAADIRDDISDEFSSEIE